MASSVFPTKGNLIISKKSFALAKTGYELLDRKRNILIREIISLVSKANKLRDKIDKTYSDAYLALQKANITLGICDDIAKAVPIENSISISYRSVMGVELPTVSINSEPPQLHYGFLKSNSQLDFAYICFDNVKRLTAELAEIENSVFRLATSIEKTQKRANALKNIIIPRFEEDIKFISDALEEKEREEFSRLKVIKKAKEKNLDLN